MRKLLSRENRAGLLLALSIVLFFYFPLIWTVFNTPKEYKNLAVYHYYEDYYEYLAFVRQGTDGKIIMHNPFTTDDPSRLITPWWPYSLLGLAGKVFRAGPVLSYWVGALVFNFAYFFLTFKLTGLLLGKGQKIIETTAVFLGAVFSSGFVSFTYNNGFEITPYEYFYSIGSPFNRHNVGTPHHQLVFAVMILFLIFFSARVDLFRKTDTDTGKGKRLLWYIIFFLFFIFLIFTSPVQGLLLALSLISSLAFFALLPSFGRGLRKVFSSYLSDPQMPKRAISFLGRFFGFLIPFLLILGLCLFAGLIINKMFLSNPVGIIGKAWDVKSINYPSVKSFFQNSGILFLLGLPGVFWYFKRVNFGRLAVFFISLYSLFFIIFPLKINSEYLLSYLGIHNMRFNNPLLSLFLSVSSYILLKAFLRRTGRAVAAYSTLCFVFFIPSLTVFTGRAFSYPASAGYLQYMSRGMYEGIKSMDTKNGKSAVLASPKSSLGLAIPALTGRNVYFGRIIFTLDFEEKKKNAESFFNLSMERERAESLMENENIGYIVFIPGQSNPGEIIGKYPSLSVYQEYPEVVVLKTPYAD